MKGLLVAAATLLAGTFLGNPKAASANAAHRVAIEPFVGQATSAFREQTVTALTNLGHLVLPERELAAAMSSLGVMRVSDNFGALAREMKATLYVHGAIWTERRKLMMGRLVVRGPTGVLVGEADWSGRNLTDVLLKIQSTIGARLATILGGRADGRPADPPPVAFRRVSNPGSGTVVEVDPGEGVRRGPSRAAAGAPSEDEENAAEISAKADAEGPGSGLSTIDVSAGTHLYSRTFLYNDNQVGVQRDFRQPAMPALTVSADYFFVPWLGVSLSGEYSLALASQDDDGNRFSASALGYSAIAQARFSVLAASIVAGAGFSESAFIVREDNAAPNAPEVADVIYRQIKAGASARIPLGSRVALLGGGSYLHLLYVGELATNGYFPNMRGLGGEGFAGLAVAIASRFELRATGTLRQYLFTMNSLPTDPRHADGATDQYLGVNLVLAFRN